ncbi:guanine nucleotide binding protein, alpha subunit [Globomyces pollinis-pini]|nr:guanine nucleotide binding protein, alpha subunit [Globomyces pollinis-pini]
METNHLLKAPSKEFTKRTKSSSSGSLQNQENIIRVPSRELETNEPHKHPIEDFHSNASLNLKAQKAESAKIDAYLASEKKRLDKLAQEPKMLILGSSDSGKSTFLKQLKIMHGVGFTNEEKQYAKERVLESILSISEFLVLNSDIDIQKKYDCIVKFIAMNSGPFQEFPESIRNDIFSMWKLPIIQARYKEVEHQFPSSMPYFLDKVVELADMGYKLSNDDYLRIRIVTKSVSETIFTINNRIFHFFDVSGLKQHRKHWIPYFDDSLSIIFLVSLSSYDEYLVEDSSINRMHDALDLFHSTINHPLLLKPSMILFLNKSDIFHEKVPRVPINKFFPQYNGREESASEGYKFFRDLFFSTKRPETKMLNIHLTCCTDTKAMKKISDGIVLSLFNDYGI